MSFPLLTAETAIAYLRERGILQGDVDGRVRVLDLSRRNHNLAVDVEGAGSWFIKQLQHRTPEVAAGQKREAVLYRAAARDPALLALRAMMPRCVDFDETNAILVLEFLNGLNAVECHMRLGPFDRRVPAILGEHLGTLHRTPLAAREAGSAALLPAGLLLKELPWVLKPSAARDGTSARGLLLSSLLADPAIGQAVEALRVGWRTDTLIHGDPRLENFVVCRPENDAVPLDVRLVDWELADIGDAAWDCANVAQQYWAQWISTGSPAPEAWDALASALSAFWHAYTVTRAVADAECPAEFRRVTLFTGLRLVQSAYEQFASTGKWNPDANRAIHVARLLLRDPDQALNGFARDERGA